MNFKVENGVLTIFLEGRIDTTNSAQVEEHINNVREQNPHTALVLDCENLNYISSSGLRIVLKLKRVDDDLSILNTSSDVYDIFEMTGFTELMKVEKAPRKWSVDGCEVIGQGSNGLVYRYSPEIVVKVYKNPDSLDDIINERKLARKAFVLGIPTAISYDIVKVGNCYASDFELLNATSFAKLLIKDENNLDMCVDMSVDLLKKIHSTHPKPGDMPEIKKEGLKWAEFTAKYLPEETGKKLIKLFENIRNDDNMIHGDFHIKNIMLQSGNEVLLIDMDTLCTGNRVFEFAAIVNAYYLFLQFDHDEAKRFLGISYELCQELLNKTLNKYFDNDEKLVKEVFNKALLVGATRLIRRQIKRVGLDSEQGQKQVEYFKDLIIKLVNEIDDLNV